MSFGYNSGGDDTKIKTPLLASIFYAVGSLVIVVSLLLAVAAFARKEKLMSVPAVLIISGSGGFVALTFFGVGQVLESIAKIEHHTSCQKSEAILHSLHRIEGHLEAIREKKERA